ncbi:hypothetical protein K466DRAFT_657712 [Polyporus arcularius HHB13444]|uniref:F-box domain-containing protein n=1 Tax=Polyporus arcularius HHB13444 TaxID=1314778 RepID=A0A5C3Q7W8_9APHY|nr:hypothetical protein K466DRAFT_657712 [Polyporus arcularius HHB13444]
MSAEDLEVLEDLIQCIKDYADEHSKEYDTDHAQLYNGDVETAFQRSLIVAPLAGSEPEQTLVSTPLRTLAKDFTNIPKTSKRCTVKPTFPMNIALEIALHLHPLALLQFSRTNRSLRASLLSSNSRRIWRATLRSVPGLPSCPEDMSEPAYVALVFDRYCMSCGTDGAFCADYALRVRFCGPCFDRNVKPGTAVFSSNLPRVVRQAALMLLPSEDRTQYFELAWMTKRTPALDPCKHALDDRYYQPEVDALIKWLWPVPRPRSQGWDRLELLLQGRVEAVVRRRAQSVVLQAWERTLLIQEDQRERALRSYAKIAERLNDENLVNVMTFDVNDIVASILWGSTLKDIDQLTREQTLRAQRRYQPMDIHLQARYAELEEHWGYVLDSHVDNYDHDVLPNRHDGGRLWDFIILDEKYQADVYDSDHSNDSGSGNDHLDQELHDPRRFPVNGKRLWNSIAESLSEDMHDYVSSIQSALSKLMPQSVPPKSKGQKKRIWSMQDNESMLLRADALFRCCQCDMGPRPYPVIHAHWRNEHPDESIYVASDRGHGNPLLNLRLCQGSYDVAHKILGAIGLKLDMKRNVLDDLLCAGRLYCSCGDPYMDPPEDLLWSDFIWHVYTHLNLYRNRRLNRRSDVLDQSLVYVNDHADLQSCIKLLPPNADTTPAKRRVCPDPYTRARVNARLAACPDGAQPVCRICAAITADEHRAGDIAMPRRADAIVYHMQAKHGRRFDEEDLLFDDSEDLTRPMRLAEKDVHLELEYPGTI